MLSSSLLGESLTRDRCAVRRLGVREKECEEGDAKPVLPAGRLRGVVVVPLLSVLLVILVLVVAERGEDRLKRGQTTPTNNLHDLSEHDYTLFDVPASDDDLK